MPRIGLRKSLTTKAKYNHVNTDMDWTIVHRDTWNPLNANRYISENAASGDLSRLGDAFANMYRAVPLYENPLWNRVLMEGFKRGDLEGILLPQFSIDVYVPSDSKTDNIVVGFLIKGVPEAVFPFRNFCQYCHGVKHVDYGDSDTLPRTSIVYVEFDREKFDLQDLFELVDQVCKLADMKAEDFSVNFPNSNKSYPFRPEVVKRYFNGRDPSKNRLSQWKANHERTKQIQKELEDELQSGAIASRLGGPANVAQPAKPADIGHAFKRLQHLSKLPGSKKDDGPKTEIDIPDTIEASIIADAKRNRTNHQFQWKDFDTRWAQRLHVQPNKISSIRKKIYDMGGG